jgi:20S proteasome alpha/beta subunit
MTVCIASMFFYFHGNKPDGTPDVAPAFITASDRMRTAAGMEYEPPLGKFLVITPNILVLVSGDITVHSELLPKLRAFSEQRQNNVSVPEIATEYARSLRQLKSERAAHYALSLYGLTPDTFIARQREMDPNLVVQYAQQMEDYQAKISAQAIVVGTSRDNLGDLYQMDSNGIVHCYNDIGFAAIGIGSDYANTEFRVRSYAITNTNYHRALFVTLLAKKGSRDGAGSWGTNRYVFSKAGWGCQTS